MKININEIIVKNRFRKDYGNIEELANDIKENGLINLIVVTPNKELITGARRLKALIYLGYTEIEVRVMTIKDYTHQILLEISENEQRKNLTFSEKMECAKQIEEIERIKAKDRQRTGLKNYSATELGRSREKVAKKIDFSESTYVRAKYVYENANKEVIKKLDNNEISITNAYNLVKNITKPERKPIPQATIKHLINKNNGKCEICGWGGIGLEGILIPHHIHKYAETEDNSINNLVLICPNCHNIIHTLENCKDNNMKDIIKNNIDKTILDKIIYYVDKLK